MLTSFDVVPKNTKPEVNGSADVSLWEDLFLMKISFKEVGYKGCFVLLKWLTKKFCFTKRYTIIVFCQMIYFVEM